MQGEEQHSGSENSTNGVSPPGSSAAGSPSGPQGNADNVRQDHDRLAQELAELKDKYVRAYAEMENIRRRHDRDRADLSKYALETIFKEFLPVFDSLERALPEDAASAAKAKDTGDYYDGMIMVKKQLLDVCKKSGLEIVQSKGVAFDPNIHQAIQRVDSDAVESETVGDVYANGYLLNGRLLRPAMVSVLTPAGS